MTTETKTIVLAKTLTEKITRFDIHQIIQHAGLMVSFILLVLTGLPLKFPNLAISQWWVGFLGGIEVTRSIHHFAASVMVIVCLYHLLYLCYNIFILKKPFPVRMLPTLQDLVKFSQELMYSLGLRKVKPEYDRYNWREKFDYWAIFWGIPIIVGSGFILMYPVLVTKFLPGWVVPAALVAHSDEAMLALTWIFVVHIFFNHFAPGVFPINTSIFTGMVSKERYRRDHPIEYQQITEADENKEGDHPIEYQQITEADENKEGDHPIEYQQFTEAGENKEKD